MDFDLNPDLRRDRTRQAGFGVRGALGERGLAANAAKQYGDHGVGFGFVEGSVTGH